MHIESPVGSKRFPERSTRIIPFLTLAQLAEANALANQRKYQYRLDAAFIRSLPEGYYPILTYTARPDQDYVRCRIAFERHQNVRLDIDSPLFHSLDRAARSVASVPTIAEVSTN